MKEPPSWRLFPFSSELKLFDVEPHITRQRSAGRRDLDGSCGCTGWDRGLDACVRDNREGCGYPVERYATRTRQIVSQNSDLPSDFAKAGIRDHEWTEARRQAEDRTA